jgi:hypothetical protein
MSVDTSVNLVANLFISFSAFTMLINVFGDPHNKVWHQPLKAWIAKLGLTMSTCGALWNVYTLSTPSRSEVLLNMGIAASFFLMSWWQWDHFKESKKDRLKKRQTRTVKKDTQ